MPAEMAHRLKLEEISLFLDADGTLLDIAPRPEQAKATPLLLETLERLYDALDGALAVVSGRRIEDIDRILAPVVLPASGVHGAQIRPAPQSPIDETLAPDLPACLHEAVAAVATGHPGAFVENKGKALAVHWREARGRECDLWRELTAALAAADEPGLAILRGHCVFEIKSAAADKGDAVRAFMRMAPYAGRTPVFIGDDVTDIAGFRAARALGGHALSVGARLECAEAVFAGPAAVRAWLANLAASRWEARRA